MTVPKSRIRRLNESSVKRSGDFVLYWMVANRRPAHNYSLDRALEWCRELGKPLVVLEALRVGYPWASDRLHAFVLGGMLDNRESFGATDVRYYPWVEATAGEGKGLLEALSAYACVVVTDDFPCFMLPRMTAAAAMQCRLAVESVDSNGIIPMRSVNRLYKRAYDFRRYVDQYAPEVDEGPDPQPLAGYDNGKASVPRAILDRWPEATSAMLRGDQLGALPIDHSVSVVAQTPGGRRAGLQRLREFLEKLPAYDSDRNHPDAEATSGLSPYLHFGHVSAHEVRSAVLEAGGESADAFLDQLVVWREIGFNMCVECPDSYARFESLPAWAQKTLGEHEDDPRPHLYTLEQWERAQTHDELWNAAQTQLVEEGRIHNYLRMLWGKKILHWSKSPREALDIMITLNDRYAIDGRDPSSYSGIFWVLGRYDRAWGPERDVFGKIRYMTSKSARRKLRLNFYLDRYASRN